MVKFEDVNLPGFPPRGSIFFQNNRFVVVALGISWSIKEKMRSLAVILYLSVSQVTCDWLQVFFSGFSYRICEVDKSSLLKSTGWSKLLKKLQ
jgi:hypothetical protein